MIALQTIQLLVAPVIMISAGGLILLALYNRLVAIVTRTRTFHKERFDARTRLASVAEDSFEARRLEHRLTTLDEQSRQMLRRARLVRNSVLGLHVMILCMLSCSLALGATLFWTAAVYAALGLFTLGVLAMMVAILLAMIELRRSLDPVVVEASAVEREPA